MENLIKTVRNVRQLLTITYGVVPVVAGADKFTNLLARWSDYLNPALEQMLPVNARSFMMLVGLIEIAAGILVFVNPHKGAYVVAAWLALIALTLLAGGRYLDIAVRDLVMAVGAFSLAKISVALKNQI